MPLTMRRDNRHSTALTDRTHMLHSGLIRTLLARCTCAMALSMVAGVATAQTLVLNAGDSNQLQLATAINTAVNVNGTPTADLTLGINQLAALPSAQLGPALDQVGGALYGNVNSASTENNDYFLRRLSDRLRPTGVLLHREPPAGGVEVSPVNYNPREGVPLMFVEEDCSGCKKCGCVHVWTDGYGRHGDVSGTADARGFDFTQAGGSFGFERAIDDCLLIGMATNFFENDLGDSPINSNIHAHGGQMAWYGRAQGEVIYMTSILSYTHDYFDSNRRVAFGAIDRTAQATFEGNEFSSYNETGLFCYLGNWNIQPYVALQYILVEQDGFTETGASSLNLSTGQETADSLRGIFGTRVELDQGLCGNPFLIPEFHTRFAREYASTNRNTFAALNSFPTNGGFLIDGAHLGRDFVVLGTALHWMAKPNLKIALGYDFTASQHITSHAGIGSLEFNW